MKNQILLLWLLFLHLWIQDANGALETETRAMDDLKCEAGWQMTKGECVATVYTTQSTIFDQALSTCQKANATLPMAHSQIEWDHRIKQIKPYLTTDSWIGLRYKPQNFSFRWMDGSEMNFQNFVLSPFPIDRTRTNCVYTNGTQNYTWFVQDCLQELPFLCIKAGYRQPTTIATEIPSTTTISTAKSLVTEAIKLTTPPVRCGDGKQSGVGCSLDPTPTTASWDQARLVCKEKNRTLVFTKSKDEWMNFQASRVSNPMYDNLWIGLGYNQKNKRLELTDGSPWISNNNDWYPWTNGRIPETTSFLDDRCAASTKINNYLWDFENCNQSSYAGLCYTTIEPTRSTRGNISFRSTTNASDPGKNVTVKSVKMVTSTSKLIVTTTKSMRYFVPKPMSKAERVSSIVVQSMACAFMLGSIGGTLVLFIVFRNFSVEKIIIANQDLALLVAHCFVMTLREPALFPSMSPQLCKTVAVLLHYFFTCAYTFMLLEALQMMYIIGHVSKSGSILPTYIILAIGWGTPLALVAITGPIIGDEYSTAWTCWGDLERRFGWALFFPMVCICACTVIIVESAGMMNRLDPPNDADSTQLFSAKISQRGIVIVMSLTVASHVLGIVAVYFQVVYLYVVCFGINVSNGVAVFFFHTAIDAKMRLFVMKIWQKVKECTGTKKKKAIL